MTDPDVCSFTMPHERTDRVCLMVLYLQTTMMQCEVYVYCVLCEIAMECRWLGDTALIIYFSLVIYFFRWQFYDKAKHLCILL